MASPITKCSLVRAEPCGKQIEQHLARLIETRALAPMQRLPTSRELARQFQVGYVAAEKALQRLKARGLIARTPRGSYVLRPSDRPVIGVLIGPNLCLESTAFYRAVSQALADGIYRRGFHDRLYSNLNQDPPERVQDTLDQLERDMANQAFQGLVSAVAASMAVGPLIVARHIDQGMDGVGEDSVNVRKGLVATLVRSALYVSVVDHEGEVLAIHIGDQIGQVQAFPLGIGRVAEEAEREAVCLCRQGQQHAEKQKQCWPHVLARRTNW